jgi:hypothetical protein
MEGEGKSRYQTIVTLRMSYGENGRRQNNKRLFSLESGLLFFALLHFAYLY